MLLLGCTSDGRQQPVGEPSFRGAETSECSRLYFFFFFFFAVTLGDEFIFLRGALGRRIPKILPSLRWGQTTCIIISISPSRGRFDDTSNHILPSNFLPRYVLPNSACRESPLSLDPDPRYPSNDTNEDHLSPLVSWCSLFGGFHVSKPFNYSVFFRIFSPLFYFSLFVLFPHSTCSITNPLLPLLLFEISVLIRGKCRTPRVCRSYQEMKLKPPPLPRQYFSTLPLVG